MRRLLLVASLFLIVVAGCLDDTQTGSGQGDPKRMAGGRGHVSVSDRIPEGWSEAALTGGAGHSHNDHKAHANMSTANFEILGYNPLITDYYGATAGSHLCGDSNEKDGRRLSVTHSFGSDIAFIISDVTDPANPEKIGEMAMLSTHVYDLTITPDQQFVLLATSPLGLLDNAQNPTRTPSPLAGQVAVFEDACTGQEVPVMGPEAGLPFASGIVLVDIANPRTPNVVDFRSFPYLGGHSVDIGLVDERPIIVATAANIPGQTSYYVFMEIMSTPAGPKLSILSIYQDLPMEPEGQAAMATVTNHDGAIHKHPVTGDHLAYLSYGNWGLVLLNINDPANPEYLSRIVPWEDVPKADAGAGYIHEAVPIDETWDGRHYTFVGDECGGHPVGTPTCLAYAIDTTDPAAPFVAGAWTLPHEVEWTAGLQYSLHYLDYVNRTLFTTVYHGGLWAVDLSDLGTERVGLSLPSIGVFMPSNSSPKPPPPGGYSPRVNDLSAMSDGTLVVYDAWSGLYTVKFHDGNPAPAPEPWALE